MQDLIKEKRRLFFKGEEQHELTESLRVIRTNLHFMNQKKQGRVVVVASTTPKEGKSTFVANYAASIAITGKKVLLIDCDIRRPRAHEPFDILLEMGLESVLQGNAPLEKVILKDIEPNLDMIPTKYVKDNVTELLLSDKMENILNTLKKHYNTIIIDTPALVVATDAAILSKLADGVVYVVAYDKVTRRELEFGKKILANANANVYGFVVNKVKKGGFSRGNYGYYNNNYEYYKEYYSNEEGKK